MCKIQKHKACSLQREAETTSKRTSGWSVVCACVCVPACAASCSGCVPVDGLRVAHRCCMIIQAETWTQAVEQIHTDTLKTAHWADSQDFGLFLCMRLHLLWGVYFTGLCLCFFLLVSKPFISKAWPGLFGSAPESNLEMCSCFCSFRALFFVCMCVCGGAYLYGHVVTQSQPDHIFHEGMFYWCGSYTSWRE